MDKTKIGREAIKLGLIRGGAIVVTLASIVILSRILGPADYGRLSTLLAIIPILCIPTSGGIGPLVLRGVARYWESSPKHLLGLLQLASLWVGVVSFFVATLTVVAAAHFYSADSSSLTFLVIALLVIQRSFLIFFSSALQGMGKIIQSQMFEQLLVPIFALLSYLVLISTGTLDLINILWAQVAAICLGLAALLFPLFRELAAQRTKSFQYETKEWFTSLNRFTILASLTVISSQQPLLITGLLGKPQDVGFLKIAISAGLLISLPLLVMNQIVAPKIAVAAREKNYDLMKELSKKAARSSLIVALPAGIFLITLENSLTRLDFGELYVDGVTSILWVIIISQVFNVVCGPVALILNMSGRESTTIGPMIISLFSTLILSLLLIPFLGGLGAALSFSFGLIVWNLLLLSAVRKQYGFNASAIGV